MKKTEDIKKYRQMSKDALAKELAEHEKKLVQASLRVKAGKLDNYSEVSRNRKTIARINTLICEKNME